MKPQKTEHTSQYELFRNELINLIDHNPELCQLTLLIDWSLVENEFGQLHIPVTIEDA